LVILGILVRTYLASALGSVLAAHSEGKDKGKGKAITPHWATGAQASIELTISQAASRNANH